MHKIMGDAEYNRFFESAAGMPPTDIGAVVWRECGPDHDPRGRLSSIWKIGAAHLHVEAAAVHLVIDGDDSGTRYPVTSEEANEKGARVEFDVDHPRLTEIGELWHALGMEGLPETVEIEGRHYAVIACPFSG